MAFVPELQVPLLLVAIRPVGEQGLRVIVRYAVGDIETDSPVGRTSWDVISMPSVAKPSATYELYFPSAPMYCVTDESFDVPDEAAEFDGAQFRRFRRSRFLDFHSSACDGQDVRPGARIHYGIYCLDRSIDIIATEAPSVAYLGPSAADGV